MVSFFSSQSVLSNTYTINVGETYKLPTPTPPAGSLDGVGYGECTNMSDCVTVNGLEVYVYKYFSGTASIQVQYSYSYMFNGKRQVDIGTAYYSVKCNPTTVILNKTELTMSIGDEVELSYTTEPSGLRPYVNWVTSDKNIVQLDYSSKESIEWKETMIINAKAEGTCTITLQTNSGKLSPQCKITVVDLNWVKSDVPSGTVVKGTLVELTSTKPEATIYYTTNGTEPTKHSIKYTQPILIDESMTLMAKAYLGNEESNTMIRKYNVVSHSAGDIFTCKTIEGVDIQMKAYSSGSSIYAQVGIGEEGYPAIDKNYTGHVTIPRYVEGMSVNQIGEYAFDGCMLSSVSLISCISSYAFRGCKNLREITIPGSSVLLPWSFDNCTSLRTISFSGRVYFSTLTSKKNDSASNVFSGCNAIKRIYASYSSPGVIQDDVFPSNVYNDATLYVKSNSVSSYKSKGGWKQFSKIESKETAAEKQIQLNSSLLGNFAIDAGSKVILSSPNAEGADIFYTLDGSTPSESSLKYTSAGVTINNDCILKCIGYMSGYEDSNILISGVYHINNGSPVSLKDVKQVSAKQYCTMMLMADKSLWVCGDNSSGQLGDGTTFTCTSPKMIMNDVAYVSMGSNHSFVVKTDGSLWACGYNAYGQLGDKTTIDKSAHIKVMDGVATAVAGYSSSMILKTDRTLWVCGDNYSGQLGDGTTTERTTPKKIMKDVAYISMGLDHSLIVKTDMTLWVCGDNYYGQLGDGTTIDRKKPVKIMEDVASVSTGLYHSLVVKTDGSLWTFGYNNYGQLGDGTTTDRKKPVKIMEDVASVSASNHSLIVKTDGSLWTCGYNAYGQLGNGTTINCTIPQKIMDGVASVSAGRFHSLIIKTDGSLWTFGSNSNSQLADGTEWSSAVPIMVVGSSEEELTSIRQTFIETNNKYYNGNLPIYNLAGQRLIEPQKGLNIIAGKKVVVR